MLINELRKLFLAGFFAFGSGALVAHIGDHEIVRGVLVVFASNCIGFWCGTLLIYKARELDDFVSITKGLDAFYADPNQSDLNKQLVANYAMDCFEAHIDRTDTANPEKEN